MGWGFVWLMLILKIPIFMLFYLVWWATRAPETTEDPSTDGGVHDRPDHARHPRRRPPRGPHGDAAPLPAPPRTRTVRGPARRKVH